MRKRAILMSLFVLAVLAVSLAAVAAQDASVQVGPITQAIIDRDSLICGVNQELPGFGSVNEAGEFDGFDIDLCGAVAAAILGDSTKVTFRPLTASDRQAAIQGGEIDMMSRNTTWTLTRDTTWGVIFGPTTYYDGQGFMVRTDSGITDLEGLDGGTVCVQSGTTTELNLADAMDSRGLAYTPQVFGDAPGTWEGYVAGRCDAFTTDVSGLVSYQGTSEDPSAHHILRNEDGSPFAISKEPLGPLSPQSDPQFADIIRWTVFGLIQAEEWGITSANVNEFISSEDPAIQRFLGQGENATGSNFGIANDFMVTVISQVGNYGEIFERNLGADTPFKLGRGINGLWTNGGLMYAPPFR